MTWQGMNKETGRQITELDHIRQSVADILTTPIGTRIMRRDYGSHVPELIDQPQNEAIRLKLMAATVMALLRWEPRIAIEQINVELGDIGGAASISLHGSQTLTNSDIDLTVGISRRQVGI